jgi:phage shock protein E
MVRARWMLGAALVLAGCATVSSEEAHRLVAAGARLVDVRSAGEYAERHVEGAISAPVEEIERHFGEIGPKDRPVVVYCTAGVRAARARRILRAAGYRTVENLGGMRDW